MTKIGLLYTAVFVVAKAAAIVVAVTLRECVKAYASSSLGDPLPGRNGRITLNPLKHLEPVGAFLLLVCGYGWGQPVQTSPMFYRNKRRDTLITHLTPILVNLALGLGSGLALRFVFSGSGLPSEYDAVSAAGLAAAFGYSFMAYMAVINVKLALFNLIPVYPMDGARILALFIKPSTQVGLAKMETILLFIACAAAAFGYLDMVFGPVVSGLTGASYLFM
ncbi:MAG: site-2 protease family protein [Clostridiales bacterium]|nr:site-2 protease family protein [Clostridiales bacterium]